MATPRDIRRCAVQALYQLDAARDASDKPTRESLLESLSDSPGDAETHKQGVALALKVWAACADADKTVAELSPDWPTHRQPVVDRNILRLGYFEIVSEETPPKVAINEAVELAREFSTDKSPAFINGVLDKVMRANKSKNPRAQTSKGQGVPASPPGADS